MTTTPLQPKDGPPPKPGACHQANRWEVYKSGRQTGLRSADRNNKATLLLTRPGRTAKSSAKDSSQRAVKLQSGSHRRALLARRNAPLLRFGARGLFVLEYDVLERIAPFRHGF